MEKKPKKLKPKHAPKPNKIKLKQKGY